MQSTLSLYDTPPVRLHRDLSYEEFFARYDPYQDGKVYAATYSFHHRDFGFWAKLAPISTLYVATDHQLAAEEFLRRFPLFEVYAVRRLHTKAIFFEKSGVLLVGSENLYKPTSTFSEVMIETVVPESLRCQVIASVFGGFSQAKALTCKYRVDDIRIHHGGNLAGFPFLPCHREVDYGDLVSSVIHLGSGARPREFQCPNRIYYLQEYIAPGGTRALAFDRGYAYCGDLDAGAFQWLIENCIIENRRSVKEGLPFAHPDDLSKSSPEKDRLLRYHPVASRTRAKQGYWLGEVKDLTAHSGRMEKLKLVDITDRKIKRK